MRQISMMLVDDHDLFREGLATIINNQPDMQVVGEAGDGLAAVVKAEELKPDLILMYIQMPVVNGMEAIAHLRPEPQFASTPIIALTALAMPGDRERCLLAGATEYLSKPVSLKMP